MRFKEVYEHMSNTKIFLGILFTRNKNKLKKINGVSDLAREMKVAHLNRLAN